VAGGTAMSELVSRATFLVGCPRSGTTIAHRALARHPAFWSPYGESHRVFEGPFAPKLEKGESNRVAADACTPEVRDLVLRGLWNSTMHHASLPPSATATGGGVGLRVRRRLCGHAIRLRQAANRPVGIHLLEKTPKNCLRIPMLAALVPGAHFVFLERSPARTIDSLLMGWRAWDRLGPFRRKRFGTYRIGRELALSDASSEWWSFALIPNWRDLRGRTTAEVCAAQFEACTMTAARDLAAIGPERTHRMSFEVFQADPVAAIDQLLHSLSLTMTDGVARFLRSEIRAPRESALRYPAEVERVLGSVADVPAGVEALLRR